MPLGANTEGLSSRREIFVIQALRAVAAILVILRHIDRDHLAIGSIGVDLFFAVSGFVMILSTARLRSMPGAATTFLRRRIIRIVPLYWLFTGLQVIRDHAVGQHDSLREILCSLFFIPYRFGQPLNIVYTPVCGVGWTLNYEMFFYLCFAVCLWLRKSPLWLAPIFAVLALVDIYQPEPSLAILFLFSYRLLIFVGGMVIARLYMSGRTLPVLPAALLLAVAIALDSVWHHDTYWVHMLVWAPTALAATYALLSFEPAFSRHAPRLLQLLGDASYSIYLAHIVLAFAFLHVVLSLVPSLRSALGFSGVSILRIVLACGFGILVHWTIELPLLRFFSIRIGGHKPAPQVLAVPSQP